MKKKSERQWARLTPGDFKELKKLTNVALIPVGSIEAHGEHNPFGVDAMWAEEMSIRAAMIEPAIVLPTIYYNLASMMEGYPGTISIQSSVVTELYKTICKEAARNGFPRIIGCVAHNGGQFALDLAGEDCFVESMQKDAAPQEFHLFRVMLSEHIPNNLPKEHDFGHGGFLETTMTMASRSGRDTVKLDRCTGIGSYVSRPAVNAHYFYNWRCTVPKGFVGDPSLATEELGNKYIDAAAKSLARVIAQARAYNPAKNI